MEAGRGGGREGGRRGREGGRGREGVEGRRGVLQQPTQNCSMSTNLLNEDIPPCHLAASSERVLHDAHDRSVALGGHDVTRHHQQLLNLRLRFQALGYVKVHLVSIKISIVGCGHTEK